MKPLVNWNIHAEEFVPGGSVRSGKGGPQTMMPQAMHYFEGGQWNCLGLKGCWAGGWACCHKGGPPSCWKGGPPPVRTFAAIWNLHPAFYRDLTVLRRALEDIDLEPFALVRIPGVAGAFCLEYADSYSAASAALALDRVAPCRHVLKPQDGMEVRAFELPFDQQRCFNEGDLPMWLQLGMQRGRL